MVDQTDDGVAHGPGGPNRPENWNAEGRKLLRDFGVHTEPKPTFGTFSVADLLDEIRKENLSLDDKITLLLDHRRHARRQRAKMETALQSDATPEDFQKIDEAIRTIEGVLRFYGLSTSEITAAEDAPPQSQLPGPRPSPKERAWQIFGCHISPLVAVESCQQDKAAAICRRFKKAAEKHGGVKVSWAEIGERIGQDAAALRGAANRGEANHKHMLDQLDKAIEKSFKNES